MNALKSQMIRSRKARDEAMTRSQAITGTMEFFMKSVALSLHEMYGFGEKRCADVILDALERCDEYTDRYGSECVISAMDARLRGAGIEIAFVEREK